MELTKIHCRTLQIYQVWQEFAKIYMYIHYNFFCNPNFLDGTCRKLASSSNDGDVIIWDSILGRCLMALTSHTMSVKCLKWGGSGLLYSASQDRYILK